MWFAIDLLPCLSFIRAAVQPFHDNSMYLYVTSFEPYTCSRNFLHLPLNITKSAIPKCGTWQDSRLFTAVRYSQLTAGNDATPDMSLPFRLPNFAIAVQESQAMKFRILPINCRNILKRQFCNARRHRRRLQRRLDLHSNGARLELDLLILASRVLPYSRVQWCYAGQHIHLVM